MIPDSLNFAWQFIRGSPEFLPVAIAALHQGNYATIANYSEGELRYMDAGE
jgi:hypothetical protein